MSPVTFGFLLAGVLLNAGAQLLLKAGTRVIGAILLDGATLPGQLLSVAAQPFIIAGLACYVLSVALWIVALSRVDVSIAYPMLSIGYVVNALLAWQLLGEAMTPPRVAGIAIILVGVLVLSRG